MEPAVTLERAGHRESSNRRKCVLQSRDVHDQRIWRGYLGGNADQFTFVYQQITGDVGDHRASGLRLRGELVVQERRHGWKLARGECRARIRARVCGQACGLSMLLDGRRNRAITLTGHRCRPLIGCAWSEKALTVTASSSANGTTWTTIGSETIGLGSAVYVGIATTSHNNSAATTAAVSQVWHESIRLRSPLPQQAADMGAPAESRDRRRIVRASMACTPAGPTSGGTSRSIPFRLSATDWRR